MNVFLKAMKVVGIALVVILLGLAIGLYILAKNPLNVSNNTIQRLVQHHDPQLTTECSSAELKFLNFNLLFTAPNIRIINHQQHFIQLKNVNFSLNLPSIAGIFSAKISKSELLNLVYFKDDPELQKGMNEYITQNNILFDGDVQIEHSFLSLKQASVHLVSETGFHHPKSANLAKINLKKTIIDLNYSFNKLTVKNFDLEYANNIKASLQGDFLFNSEGLTLADFQANVIQLPIDYLAGLWPQFLAPEVQHWVTTNITQGMVKKAQGKFKITAEDIESALPSKDSINAKIEISGARLTYLQGYSPITQIDAMVKFDGQALYVNASKASLHSNNLSNVELIIPFNDFILSLKTNVIGKINQFKEFIPDFVFQKLLNNKVDFNKIKGNLSGSVALSIPIFDPFKLESLKLDIKANLNDVVLDQYELLKFKHGALEIINDQDKITVKLQAPKSLSFDFIKYHNFERQKENQINLTTKLDLQEKISLSKLVLEKGIIDINASLSEEKWQLNLDLKNTEVQLIPLGITKPIATALSFNCTGSSNENTIIGENCSLKGNDFAGTILFSYSTLNNQLTSFSLNNGKIYDNMLNIKIGLDKNLYSYALTAKQLNLSKFDMKDFSSDGEKKINYKIDFKVNQLILKNEVHLNDVSGKIAQIANNPLDIDLKAFSKNHQLTIVKMKKNDQNGYLLHSDSAATFSQAFGIYKNIKRGEVWIEVYPKKIDDNIIYNGNIIIKNFAFSNTSVLTKIILGVMSPFNSPLAVVQAIEGGSLKAETFTADLEYNKGILTIKNGLVQGPSYDIRIDGTVNNNTRILAIKGMYIPSAYGINSLISFIPFIGDLLSGGKKSAFIAANFSVKGSFDNPNIWLNPLSVFTPGFIRNLFN